MHSREGTHHKGLPCGDSHHRESFVPPDGEIGVSLLILVVSCVLCPLLHRRLTLPIRGFVEIL